VKTCFEVDIDGAANIKLEQREDKHGRFRVTYGQHVVDGLPYIGAATEFGLCVFHALACESRLDNSKD
jgi:hypothetical protein